MSKVTEVEVHFNAKSSAQTISEALALATKHRADTSEKTCSVRFTDAADPDLQKLLTLVSTLKGSKVIVNGQEYKPNDVLTTLYCVDRQVCKGACKHLRLRYQRLEEFLLWYKPYIKGITLTTQHSQLISHFSSFIEAQKENEYIVKKDLLQDYFAEQTKFEAEFCEKYQKAKLEEVVQQFPEKIVLNPMVMGVGISPHRAEPSSRGAPRQRKSPERQAFARYIDAYYSAQIHGQVLQHYLATLLHRAFPDKIEAPTALSPDALILGLGLVPEAQKGKFYADLWATTLTLDYWKKAVALERNPSVLADLYLARGESLIEEGQPETAVQLLQEGLRKCGEDLLLLERLAELEVEQKDFKAAVDHLRRALEVAPDEWTVIQESPAFAPLQDLQDFQILKTKYGTEGQ